MTDPVERERRKYRWAKYVHQWTLMNRIAFWLPIAFFCGIGLLMDIFAKP